jgi:tetratricopeptide (TPR) repeat protein
MSTSLHHGLGGLLTCALLAGCGATEPSSRARSRGGPRPSADVVEGKRLYDELRYREAEACFRRAHEAEPDDPESRDYLLRIELLTCSKPRGQLLSTGCRTFSVEREKDELQALQREGEALLDAGEVELASARFERVLERLRWFPYEVDDGSLKTRAEECLSAARAVLPPRPRPTAPAATREEPPQPTQPEFVTGLRHYEAFDYKQAAACFRRAAQAEPGDVVIQHYVAMAELLCGERVAEFERLVGRP